MFALGLLALPLLATQCKKDDDSGPSTYRLTAVDELTGEALANAPVILEEVNDGSVHFDTIGITNDTGGFEYVFTGQPTTGSQQGYHQWYLHFVRSDYYKKVYAGLQQDHQEHEATVGLVKRAVIRVRATRLSAESAIWFGFANDFDQFGWYAFQYLATGEVGTHYQSVPSNRTTLVKWQPFSNPDSTTTIPVSCGHGDTSFVEIEF